MVGTVYAAPAFFMSGWGDEVVGETRGIPASAGNADGARIVPNKGRKLQVAATRRKLFGRAAQQWFLEHFAATANTAASARATGIAYSTVYRKRASCPELAAAWEAALAQGYARLEELAVREAIAALERKPGAVRADPAAIPTTHMDPTVALQLLREHKRGLAGVPKPGRTPTVASNAEVRDALLKRLKAFGIRVRKERGR